VDEGNSQRLNDPQNLCRILKNRVSERTRCSHAPVFRGLRVKQSHLCIRDCFGGEKMRLAMTWLSSLIVDILCFLFHFPLNRQEPANNFPGREVQNLLKQVGGLLQNHLSAGLDSYRRRHKSASEQLINSLSLLVNGFSLSIWNIWSKTVPNEKGSKKNL
jgi:hypothetical protein